jgi:hypothetical protein
VDASVKTLYCYVWMLYSVEHCCLDGGIVNHVLKDYRVTNR